MEEGHPKNVAGGGGQEIKDGKGEGHRRKIRGRGRVEWMMIRQWQENLSNKCIILSKSHRGMGGYQNTA